MSTSSDDLEILPVTPEHAEDFDALFEARGAPKSCWCMVWRGSPAERKSKTSRRTAMRSRIRDGVPVGLLAYREGEPVGWCSVAPRETYRALGGIEGEFEDGEIWSIVCFFVLRAYRGEGVMRVLLDAAIEHARREGARRVEAYPVDRDSPSYRFMGFREPFAERGFEERKMAGSRRHVVTLDLS